MSKKTENWGPCPLRVVGWANLEGVHMGWCYICGKTGKPCDSDYCLGPDEDLKGDQNEQEVG